MQLLRYLKEQKWVQGEVSGQAHLRPYSPPLFTRFPFLISQNDRHSRTRLLDLLPVRCITGAKKHPLRNTIKEKEFDAVFSEILRFLLFIQGFFSAVDRIHGIRCSPEFSDGKRRPIWGYFGCPHMKSCQTVRVYAPGLFLWIHRYG